MIFLCALDAIPTSGARLHIGETSLFALRFDGEITSTATAARISASNWWAGDVFDRDDTLLQCATHGALVLPHSGECIAGPCRSQRLQAVAMLIDGDAHVEP